MCLPSRRHSTCILAGHGYNGGKKGWWLAQISESEKEKTPSEFWVLSSEFWQEAQPGANKASNHSRSIWASHLDDRSTIVKIKLKTSHCAIAVLILNSFIRKFLRWASQRQSLLYCWFLTIRRSNSITFVREISLSLSLSSEHRCSNSSAIRLIQVYPQKSLDVSDLNSGFFVFSSQPVRSRFS